MAASTVGSPANHRGSFSSSSNSGSGSDSKRGRVGAGNGSSSKDVYNGMSPLSATPGFALRDGENMMDLTAADDDVDSFALSLATMWHTMRCTAWREPTPLASFKVFNVVMLRDCKTKELAVSTRFFYIPYAGALHTCLSRTNPPLRV